MNKTNIKIRVYIKDFESEHLTIKQSLVDGYMWDMNDEGYVMAIGLECDNGNVIRYPIRYEDILDYIH